MSKEPRRNVYVGHRYVPKIMGEWNQEETYEGLSIVTHKGTSYTSKKRVPIGIDISNEDYWAVTGNYNAQIENYRSEVESFDGRILKNMNDIELLDTKLNEVESFDGRILKNMNDIELLDTKLNEDINEKIQETNNDVLDNKNRIIENDNRIDDFVSPKNFNSIDDCIEFAFENAKTIKANELVLTQDTSFRSVGLDINIIYTNGFTLELGGLNFIDHETITKRDKRYNPKQYIGKIIDPEFSLKDRVFIRGMSHSELTIGNYNGFLQFRLNDFDNDSQFMSYSTFYLGDIIGISIKEDPNSGNTGNPLWFSENKVYIRNTMYFEMGNVDGYTHSMNTFYGGVFESGAETTIHIISGSYNTFYNIRGEAQPLEIKFGEKTRYNKIEMNHYSYSPLVIDNGFQNVVTTVTEENNRLILNESLQYSHLYSGDLTTDEEVRSPFRNLEYNTDGKYYTKNSLENAGEIFYETPFLKNPSELRFLLESNIIGDNGFGVGYKYYDKDYNEISGDFSGSNRFQAYILTSREKSAFRHNEGGYFGPSLGHDTMWGNSNSGQPGQGIKNDILSLIPSSQWYDGANKDEAKNRIKYVKFFIGNLYQINTEPVKFRDLTISVYNMVNNYHKKYFSNYMTDFLP